MDRQIVQNSFPSLSFHLEITLAVQARVVRDSQKKRRNGSERDK